MCARWPELLSYSESTGRGYEPESTKQGVDQDAGRTADWRAVRDVGGDILGAVRKNGDVLRYNARTNEFAVGAADGTIRTLFRPQAGMDYWQAVTSGP